MHDIVLSAMVSSQTIISIIMGIKRHHAGVPLLYNLRRLVDLSQVSALSMYWAEPR